MPGWTEKKTELLKKLCAERLSFSEIGERLGMSRNAVLGKAYRMGFANPLTRGKKKRGAGSGGWNLRKKKSTKPWQHMQVFGLVDSNSPKTKRLKPDHYTPPPEDYIVPQAQRKDLIDLEDHHCRWPIDKAGGGFEFCGGEKLPGVSYCRHHCARAFVGSAVKVREISSTHVPPHYGPELELTAKEVEDA